MKRKYKKSQFNYVSHNKDSYVVYNTLYNSLTRLSDEEYAIYLSEQCNNSDITEQMIKQGIWVAKDIDEREQYNWYVDYANRYTCSKPHLTVTPTMECNARCFYCYEEGVRCGRMRQEECENIVRFLKTLNCSQGIDITWFGGEPLMNQEWMNLFSDCLKAEKIEFSAFMITNGSLINDTTIDNMVDKWNIQDIQITLDGSYEEYSSRKRYIDQDASIYYKILRTVGKLSARGINVHLRMNIDRDNRDSVLKAAADINELFRENHKVNYYPAFLNGTDIPLTEKEKIEFVKKMIENSQGKFDFNECLYRLPRTMACYYYQENAYAIDANGNVFTCEHSLGHERKSLGNVKTEILISKRAQSGKRKECQRCVFLPKCQGGCNDALEHGEVPCFIEKYIIKAYLELL